MYKLDMHELSIEQKEKLLNLLFEMGHNSMWYAEAVAKWLNEIHINAKTKNNNKTLVIFNQDIDILEPEWGEAGIYAPTIAYAIAIMENIRYESNYTGSGFIFKDLLDKIALHWGLSVRFL